MALSLEFCCSEQTWRSPAVLMNFVLQIEASKHTVACCLSFPVGGSLYPHPANFLSQAPGKVLLRVHLFRAVIPESGLLEYPVYLQYLQSQKESTAMCTHPLHPFCSVGEV